MRLPKKLIRGERYRVRFTPIVGKPATVSDVTGTVDWHGSTLVVTGPLGHEIFVPFHSLVSVRKAPSPTNPKEHR